MTYAFFLGCTIPARLRQYEISARAILSRLGVGVVDYREFSCCGYPLRNVDRKAFLLSAARNLAIAERDGCDVLSLCKCGFGTLKEAQYRLRNDEDTRRDINRILEPKGLEYRGRTQVKHLLSVLYDDVGLGVLKQHIKKAFKNLNVAAHYGCHALRPSRVTQFDDPVAPTLFDALVEVTGAESVDWSEKLSCCGAPLMGVNDRLSMNLTQKKFRSSTEAGADYLCTACPYCQIQFDQVRGAPAGRNDGMDGPPAILYPQLLGLSMGMDKRDLGLNGNQPAMDAI